MMMRCRPLIIGHSRQGSFSSRSAKCVSSAQKQQITVTFTVNKSLKVNYRNVMLLCRCLDFRFFVKWLPLDSVTMANVIHYQ